MATEGIRRGSPTAFWNAAVISSGATSNGVQVGRDVNQFTFFVNSSGTGTFLLQVAHVGAFSAEGILPDPDQAPNVWHDLWYLGTSGLGNSTQVQINGTGAFTVASIVPDFEPNWVRLKCTAGTAITVTAGFEAWGD